MNSTTRKTAVEYGRLVQNVYPDSQIYIESWEENGLNDPSKTELEIGVLVDDLGDRPLTFNEISDAWDELYEIAEQFQENINPNFYVRKDVYPYVIEHLQKSSEQILDRKAVSV